MNISPPFIEAFQELWQLHLGEELKHSDAEKEAGRLLELIKLIYEEPESSSNLND